MSADDLSPRPDLPGDAPSAPSPKRPLFDGRSLALSTLVAPAVFAVLLSTASIFPLTWDEGDMGFRARFSSFWVQRVLYRIPGVHWMIPTTGAMESVKDSDSLDDLFSEWGLSTYWTGTTWLEGHPQLPVILVASGRQLAPFFLSERVKLRFGPVLFFALAIGAVFYRLRTDFGRATAWFGILAVLLIPRLFAHAQIAAWDSTLTASWLLCWATFPYALKSPNGAVVFGSCLGMAFASKFPGLAVVLPFGLWLLLRLTLDRAFFAGKRILLAKSALIASVAAVTVFFFLTPPIWNKPVAGILAYFSLNMNREINVAILFLGKIYDLHHSLPWYNTLFWTAITVPVGLLALFGVGVYSIVRDESRRWAGLLILLNMSTLLVVRAFPGTPVHDGVRLFIAAFPFLGIVAGLGAATLWNAAPGRFPLRKAAGRIVVLGVYAACFFNMFLYAPQWLSYYNLAIGGLPGAARAGMEPTYYWDGLDAEVIDWINEHTGPDELVAFSSGDFEAFGLYYEEGRLRPGFVGMPGESKRAQTENFGKPLPRSAAYTTRYYILQRRPSAELDWDKRFIREETPVFVKTIRRGGWGPWNLSTVPIIEIYDVSDLPEWQRQPFDASDW